MLRLKSMVILAMVVMPCLAPARVLNDGTTTNGLSLVSNIPYLNDNPPDASSLAANAGGWLHLTNVNRNANVVRAAWMDGSHAPATRTLTVSADLRTADNTSNDRAGVIILNTANNKGVILYIRAPATLRIATLDLSIANAADTVIASSGPSSYTATTFANFSLWVAPLGTNTQIGAIVVQGNSTNVLSYTGYLGDYLSTNPANIRVGYFGYYALNTLVGYNVGDYKNLSLTPIVGDQLTVYQPGEGGIKYSYIDNTFPSNNPGNQVWINVGHGDGSNLRNLWGLIQFQDLSSLPANVSSAKLQLYRYGGSGSGTTLSAYQIMENWDSTSVVWTNKPALNATAISATNVPGDLNIWHTVDITPLYKAWKAGTAANYGVELCTSTNNGETFGYRSPHYLADPTLQPKLVLTLAPPPLGSVIAVY